MKVNIDISEQGRRGIALGLAVGGWLSALVVAILDVAGIFAQHPAGVVVILLVGISIAASLSRTRMRMTDTITGVFRVGLEASRARKDIDYCTIAFDRDGRVVSVSNGNVIGPGYKAIIGENIKDLHGLTESYDTELRLR